MSADSADGVVRGWLVVRQAAGGAKSSGSKRWFVLRPDFVLYSFRGEADTVALTATPVPGLRVASGAELRQDKHHRQNLFNLFLFSYRVFQINFIFSKCNASVQSLLLAGHFVHDK